MARRKPLKVAPRYTMDGMSFQTKSLLQLYRLVTELAEIKLIDSFNLPTLEQDGKIKTGKFNAVKCTIDDMLFDSTMEARYYCELVCQRHEKKILDFIVKPTYELQEKFKKNGKTVRPITYTPDYEIIDLDENHTAIDVKGRKTDSFILKQKMFDYKFQETPLICLQYNEKEDRWFDIDVEKKAKRKAKAAASKPEAPVKKKAAPKRKKQDN